MYYLVLAVIVLLLSLSWIFPIAVFHVLTRLLVLFSPFKSKSVTLENGQHCAYIEKGSLKNSKVTVLMLHGFTASYMNYIQLGKKFDKSYHLIAIDWLNHGNSTQIKKLVKVEDVVNFVHMFVEKACLVGRKVHIVGHSTGGFIAVHYATRHPQQCASLSLLSPLGVLTNEFLDVETFISPKSNEDFKKFLMLVSSGKAKLIPPFMMNIVRLQRCSMSDAYFQVYNGIIKNAKFTVDDMKKISNIPSMLVWGDNDLLLPSSPGVEFFKAHSPNTEIHVMKGCGHLIPETDVKEVHHLLDSWFMKKFDEKSAESHAFEEQAVDVGYK